MSRWKWNAGLHGSVGNRKSRRWRNSITDLPDGSRRFWGDHESRSGHFLSELVNKPPAYCGHPWTRWAALRGPPKSGRLALLDSQILCTPAPCPPRPGTPSLRPGGYSQALSCLSQVSTFFGEVSKAAANAGTRKSGCLRMTVKSKLTPSVTPLLGLVWRTKSGQPWNLRMTADAGIQGAKVRPH
jgi:hypothetical protein